MRPELLIAASFFAGALAAAPQSASRLTLAEQEEFLRTARPGRQLTLKEGVTGARRITLEKNGFRHDAQFQTVEIRKAIFEGSRSKELNFKDTFTFNVAAYELAKLLGIADMLPPSIQRRIHGVTGALTWWIDDVMMEEKQRMRRHTQPPDADAWNREVQVVRVFDQLIGNSDRNLGNLLIDKSWRIWMIDHTRAFRRQTSISNPANLTRCDRDLLARMRQLNRAQLKERLGSWLDGMEINGLLRRRDEIVQLYDAKVAESGESTILFDRPKRN